jgi:glucitol operon activator protein
MPIWQIALLVLVAAWAVQSLGVWMQMRHYRQIFNDMRLRWSDGAIGAGAAPGRLGKGVIAIVVASPDGVVRKVALMEGRSVFAKFKDRLDLEGGTTTALKERATSGKLEGSAGVAIRKAIEQIETVGARPGEAKPNAAAA